MWINQLDTWISMQAQGLGWPAEGLLRLFLAAMCGGLVGIEREIRGRQAGFRTFLLVCLGSALAMVVSVHFAHVDWAPNKGTNINVDPARIAYGVMAGIGFLGGGVIVHSKGAVRGLTTAAGLWCIAAVGLSAGLGLYLISVFAMALLLVTLWFLDYAADWLPKVKYRTVTLRVPYEPGCVARVVEMFRSSQLDVIDAGFERTPDMLNADIQVRIAFTDSRQYFNLERQLESPESQRPYQLLSTREL